MTPTGNKYWRDLAACRGMDTEIFFPEKGDSGGNIRTAKKVCSTCPVSGDCLDFAMKQPDDRYGIFGGFTYTQRRVIRRLLKDNPNFLMSGMIEVEKMTRGKK